MGRVEYFQRWVFDEGRGVQPLTKARAATVHAKGSTYAVYIPEEHVVLTLRPETAFVDLGLLSPAGAELGGITWQWGQPDGITELGVIRTVIEDGSKIRLQRRPGDGEASVLVAPFREPKSFAMVPDYVAVTFPAFGEYHELVALPRDPWAYVSLPDGFQPPTPR